jgi:hypothetical protein
MPKVGHGKLEDAREASDHDVGRQTCRTADESQDTKENEEAGADLAVGAVQQIGAEEV